MCDLAETERQFYVLLKMSFANNEETKVALQTVVGRNSKCRNKMFGMPFSYKQ